MSNIDTGIVTFSRIFKLSFSGKKIAIQILGILCACIAWFIITGLGGLVLNERLYGLVLIINWIVITFIMFITWGAIAKVTIAEVGELPPVSLKAAIRIALKCIRPLIIAPLKIVVIILAMMFVYWLASLIGLIPGVGEIVWPFFTIPLFILSAIIVVAKLILLCGGLLLPTIIMVGKQSPVSELNDFLRENTLRFIGYLIATAFVVFIVLIFLSMVITQNTGLANWFMGEKYTTIVASVPTKLSGVISRVEFTFNNLLKAFSPRAVTENLWSPGKGIFMENLRWTYSFAGFVWGIFTFIIYLAISSLPLVVWGVSGTLIYLGLKPEAIPQPQEQCECTGEKKEQT